MKTANRARSTVCIIIAALVLVILSMTGMLRVGNLARADEANSGETEELLKRASKLKFEGERAERKGRQKEALSLFEEAASIYEEAKAKDEGALSYLDYMQLAGCYGELGRDSEAIDTLENGIRKKEESGQTDETYTLHIQLANIYEKKKEFDKAIEIYKEQSALGQNYADWYTGLARLYEQKGDIDNTEEIYKSGFYRFFFDQILYAHYVGFLMDHGYLDEAETITYAALVLMQDDPLFPAYAYKVLLAIYERQGKNEEFLDWTGQKLEEAERKREEFNKESTPEEQNLQKEIVLYIVVYSVGFAVLIMLIILLVWHHVRKKRSGRGSRQTR